MAVLIMAVTLGCSKPKEEGPAEKEGKKVDEAVEKAQSYTSEKTEEVGKAMERAAENLEKKK
jgi:hypothetical protein